MREQMLPTHLTIHQAQQLAHAYAVDKGFWEDATAPVEYVIATKLALIHSELSEALEEVRRVDNSAFMWYNERDGKPEGVAVELADAVIRILDLSGWLGIDLEDAIDQKMAFNRSRPYKHGRSI